jgi:hypothetical protein
MALASQSTRSDRSFNGSNRNGLASLLPRVALISLAAAGAIGVGYWIMRADGVESADSLLPNSGAGSFALSIPSGVTAKDANNGATALDHALALTDTTTSSSSAPPTPPATAPAAAPNLVPQIETPTTPPSSTPGKDAAPAVTPTIEPSNAPTITPPPAPGNGFDTAQQITPPTSAITGSSAEQLARGLTVAANDPVQARALLSTALLSGQLNAAESHQAASALTRIGQTLVFTPVYNANDPTFFQYTIAAGDSLEKIVRKQKLGCDWRLVARINNIKKPESIRVGQRLKLPRGPFSAVISKRDYRVDLCMGVGESRVVFASLPCGLGEANGTPIGRFRVKPGSKLLDPEWAHPVTGEHFESNNPKNPIGEHWLGLEGLEATNAQLAGYGIHGTIDIDSIGHDRSLGCVRLLADDVAVVWESLPDGATVEIR